jgi:GR25 family glycosyltransferase involved in LPS biosynthesis
VIALDALHGGAVAAHVKAALRLSSTHVLQADNGTNHTLPLYTRHLIDHGRRDHLSIGNPQMVGCLMSHVAVWRQISDWAYVFEEDVVLQPGALAAVHQLLRDTQPHNWSIMILLDRASISTGAHTTVGTSAATCADCTWYGTRGYIITRSGAQILLEHYWPISVQVDALIGLVNHYDPRFTLMWSRRDVAGSGLIPTTTVWDGCLRCFVPTQWNPAVITAWAGAVIGAGATTALMAVSRKYL